LTLVPPLARSIVSVGPSFEEAEADACWRRSNMAAVILGQRSSSGQCRPCRPWPGGEIGATSSSCRQQGQLGRGLANVDRGRSNAGGRASALVSEKLEAG